MTLYFDRCFGRRFPEALRQSIPPFQVEYHHSSKIRFAANTPDDEWLSDIGKRGWIVFSHDRRFHREMPAASAIKQHSIGCFYLWGAEATTWEKMRFFVRNVDKIVGLARRVEKPFIYHIQKTGRESRVLLE